MVKIRYADLPGGLHVRAVARGKDTIIYLVPGLTVMQRRNALRRLRSSARVGHGPRLPAAGVAGAMMADGTRTTLRNTAAAVRAHPATFIPQIVIIVFAAVAYVLLVSGSGRPHPAQPRPATLASAPAAAAPAGGLPVRQGSSARAPGHPGAPAPTLAPGGHHSPGPAPTHLPPSPRPQPTRTSSPTPAPSPTPTRRPVPNPGPTPTPTSQFPTPQQFAAQKFAALRFAARSFAARSFAARRFAVRPARAIRFRLGPLAHVRAAGDIRWATARRPA